MANGDAEIARISSEVCVYEKRMAVAQLLVPSSTSLFRSDRV